MMGISAKTDNAHGEKQVDGYMPGPIKISQFSKTGNRGSYCAQKKP